MPKKTADSGGAEKSPLYLYGAAVSARTHVKLSPDFVRSFRLFRFVPLFTPASQLLTALALCFAMGLIVPAQSIAQEQTLPPFDSFSYLKNPLFSPLKTVNVTRTAGSKAQGRETSKSDNNEETKIAADHMLLECPSIEPKAQLTGMDEFETRLAIDKALSQILKLTVDYGALRQRVSSLCQPAEEQDSNWFTFGQKGSKGEKQLEALQEINQKQIADRDKQLALLQTRLEATKKRYDNENVARLLAEKRLKAARDGVKKNNAKVSRADQKVQKLAEQLEKSQAVIRQLKIELADDQLKLQQLSAEFTAKPQQEMTIFSAPATAAAAKSLPGLTPGLSEIHPASEWIIGGLKFERGSAEIMLESALNLDKLLEYLKQNNKLHIQVNGYTDSIGSAASNMELSQSRAQAVADYLQQHGVNQNQITVLAYGERRPVADNETEAGRVKNRRVAVLFLN